MTPRKFSMAFTLHLSFLLAIVDVHANIGQRVITIQLDGTQYYVSKMNPYSSELNYFLAYQYCRSLGLQLVSFETQEKADAIAEYLKNAGYSQHDFWTSGNHLGSNMLLWMSTGLPFNATFNYIRKAEGDDLVIPSGPLPMGRKKRGNNGIATNGCIALKANTLDWDTEDCSKTKEFICEQTRCYFYNYGPISVSPAQGNKYKKSNPPTLNSSTTQHFSTEPSAITTPVYSSVSTSSVATTTVSEIRVETEHPAPANNEEENNELDLTTTQSTIDDEQYETTSNDNVKQEEQTDEENGKEVATQNRSRTTKTLESESDSSHSARIMPSEMIGQALPWAWAKNILLEKPVLKKTAQI